MCHDPAVPKALGETSLRSHKHGESYYSLPMIYAVFIHEVCCDFYELRNNLVHSHSNLLEFYFATYVRTN